MPQDNKKIPLHFLNKLVLRTPALPFRRTEDVPGIEQLLEDNLLLEAIYLATPVLYNECLRLRDGKIADEKEARKVTLAILKYYQRMYSRSTPFGLFSGCAVVEWNDGPTHITIDPEKFSRSTRLDMHYLCVLAQQISELPAIRERLLFFPNNSAYRVGDEIRFIEYHYGKNGRMHQISSVAWSDYLQLIIDNAAEGITPKNIMRLLIQHAEVNEEEATEFTKELIESQVIISEMDPAVTGEEFLYQVHKKLQSLQTDPSPEIESISDKLTGIITSLKTIDQNRVNPVDEYRALTALIKDLQAPYEENKLLQTDYFHSVTSNSVDQSVQQELLNAMEIMATIRTRSSSENLQGFMDRFRNRYEDKGVPLLEALDTETGIGYLEQTGKDLSPLSEGLLLPGANDPYTYDIKWDRSEQWLFKRLSTAENGKVITITKEDLSEFTESPASFPPSMSVMFSLADNGKILFRGCSGSSAVNLLGRFAHGDKAIHALADEIVAAETSMNNDIVFAEIVHLPEDRIGNILQRPSFHKYEIPFLAQSSVGRDEQLMLQDLFIRIQDGRVIISSKKNDKEIIPRLSTAHNFSMNALPVYQFLADLQSQNLVSGLGFSWGSMAAQFNYLPRVETGNVIIAEATWQLQKKDFALLLDNKLTIDVVTQFWQRWQLPSYIVLADGDNELLIDRNNLLSVEAFISTIRKREFIVLKEYLLPDAGAVMDAKGNTYQNQFVAIVVNENKVYAGQPVIVSTTQATIQREFWPGSEWLYYKIYCGTKMADTILTDFIQPFTEALKGAKLIDKWFFIRFYDPDFHIRFRLHLPDTESTGKVMSLFNRYFDEGKFELAHKVQVDTYRRELERYGGVLTTFAEDLFCEDSDLKLQFLQLTSGDEREDLRWAWGMRGIDELLNAFGYDIAGKHEVMQFIQSSFIREFRGDKALFKQLNERYNTNKKQIALAMEHPVSAGNPLKPLIDLYHPTAEKLTSIAASIIGQTGPPQKNDYLARLMGSYIHMNLNRLFLSEARLQEMILYDFLCSWYRSLMKREASAKN